MASNPLVRCTDPDVGLFGPTQLTLWMKGPRAGLDDTFEEQIGRTSIRSLSSAASEEAVVNDLETACFKQAIAQGQAIATFNSPSQPVLPWDRLLDVQGAVQAWQQTYRHETDTELDVIKDGYFARLIVTTSQGSTATDELLRAAVRQM